MWIFAILHLISTDLHRLNASEQKELASRMERKQLKEFMTVCTAASLCFQSSS